MKKRGRALLLLAAGLLSGLALVGSAAGTRARSATTVRHLQLPVAALALDGSRVAYDLTSRDAAATKPNPNRVLVWNVRTGKTVKISGKKTAAADSSSTGAGVIQLAIAGSRVAWLMNLGGNLEGDDYLLTSSVTSPKERRISSAVRVGDNCAGRGTHCAGPWLGGLVGSGNSIALNRWTTDSQGNVYWGGLSALKGTQLHSIATGAGTVWAVASDGGREAVLRADGAVAVYSASGNVLTTVNPPSAQAVALSGRNLVVLTQPRRLALYDAQTGALKKTLAVQGKGQGNLDVQGNVAIYTTGSSVHAVNLLTGRDRAVGTLPYRIAFARVDGAGLAYAANGVRGSFGKATLEFVPFAQVKAAVS